MDFVYEAHAARVLFGKGRKTQVGAELDRLGIRNAIVLATPAQSTLAAEFAALIGTRAAVVWPGARMHTPVEVTEAALGAVRSGAVDGILAVGGGSTIGLGKAIALRTDLPQLVVPTTYAGSEMTPILGETVDGVKTTRSSPKILPETVIYDPDLTATLPAVIAGPSGMNAIAHAVEALYAEAANPVVSLMAEECIRALGQALPILMSDAGDEAARADALYGAWLGGICLGAVGMAIHHKICHTLGGSFDLNHADIHCLMLPYTAAYNREAAPEAMARVARALGRPDDAPGALFDLLQKVGRFRSLRDFGLSPADLDRATGLALKNPYYNPRPITVQGVRAMLEAAYEGRRP
jgi:alcohol dehydrogenase class IV